MKKNNIYNVSENIDNRKKLFLSTKSSY